MIKDEEYNQAIKQEEKGKQRIYNKNINQRLDIITGALSFIANHPEVLNEGKMSVLKPFYQDIVNRSINHYQIFPLKKFEKNYLYKTILTNDFIKSCRGFNIQKSSANLLILATNKESIKDTTKKTSGYRKWLILTDGINTTYGILSPKIIEEKEKLFTTGSVICVKSFMVFDQVSMKERQKGINIIEAEKIYQVKIPNEVPPPYRIYL